MSSSNLYLPFAGHQTRVALPINMTYSSPGCEKRLFTSFIIINDSNFSGNEQQNV